jgi:hypothetical protein
LQAQPDGALTLSNPSCAAQRARHAPVAKKALIPPPKLAHIRLTGLLPVLSRTWVTAARMALATSAMVDPRLGPRCRDAPGSRSAAEGSPAIREAIRPLYTEGLGVRIASEFGWIMGRVRSA